MLDLHVMGIYTSFLLGAAVSCHTDMQSKGGIPRSGCGAAEATHTRAGANGNTTLTEI